MSIEEPEYEHIEYPHTLSFEGYRKEKLQEQHFNQKDGIPNTFRNRGKYRGTIKLHGTNVSIVYRDSDQDRPTIQSRNRIITTTSDNVGTVAFLNTVGIKKLIERILEIQGITAFETIIIAGEFAGGRIQKGVALAALDKFFCIFNICIDGVWVDMARFKSVEIPEKRVFNIMNYKTYEVEIDLEGDTGAVFEEMMQYTKDVAAQCPFGAAYGAAGVGEGIVWTLIPEEGDSAGHPVLFNFKTKGEEFAVAAYAPKVQPTAPDSERSKAFVDYALTERRQQQGIEYMQEMGMEIVKKNVEKFVKWVVEDTLREEGQVMKDMGADEKVVKKLLWTKAKDYWLAKCTA